MRLELLAEGLLHNLHFCPKGSDCEIVDNRLRFPVPEAMMPWQKDEMERFGFVEVDGYFYTTNKEQSS